MLRICTIGFRLFAGCLVNNFTSYELPRMESRDKRNLPEVVAEILIEQHAMRVDIADLRQKMREEIGGLRQEIVSLRQYFQVGLEISAQIINGMTNAILDAINRQYRPLQRN